MEPLWTDEEIESCIEELSSCRTEKGTPCMSPVMARSLFVAIRDDCKTECAALTQRIAELERTIEQNDAVRAELWEHIRALEARQPSAEVVAAISKLFAHALPAGTTEAEWGEWWNVLADWLDTLQEATHADRE